LKFFDVQIVFTNLTLSYSLKYISVCKHDEISMIDITAIPYYHRSLI